MKDEDFSLGQDWVSRVTSEGAADMTDKIKVPEEIKAYWDQQGKSTEEAIRQSEQVGDRSIIIGPKCSTPSADTPLAELLDDFKDAAQNANCECWAGPCKHAQAFTEAKSAIESAFSKLRAEIEEYKKFGLTLRCVDESCSAFPSVHYCTSHAEEIAALSLENQRLRDELNGLRADERIAKQYGGDGN